MPLLTHCTFIVLCGKTGSGKTATLHQLESSGFPVINLEKIASHRGSAFGAVHLPLQPSQYEFEKELESEVLQLAEFPYVFIEQKPPSIGKRKLPPWFLKKLNEGIFVQLNVNKQVRIDNLLREYGTTEIKELRQALNKIARRLPEHAFNECDVLLTQSNLTEFVKRVVNYYDNSLKYATSRLADIIIPVQNSDTFYIMQQLLDALRKNGINTI